MEPAQEQSLAAALDALWARFEPEMLERVATLEAAAEAFKAGRISPAQHEAAHAAAHKLAGSLGIFGLTQGTLLARELESLYSRESGLEAAMAAQLTGIAAELRVIIESRKPG
jgi:HPt (histidine-containing phosphotransfer) domain-containing protein